MTPASADSRTRSIGYAIGLCLYFVGAALASCALQSAFDGVAVVVAVAGFATGIHVTANISKDRGARVIRRISLAMLGVLHFGWVYLAITFGWLLAWTIPWSIRAALLAVALLALFNLRRPLLSVRVPVVFPLGLWIAMVLLGWWREDGVLRCDDYTRLVSNPATSLAVPTTRAVESCSQGGILRLQRYPRRLWEAPDGSRFIVATQQGINYPEQGTPVLDPIEGEVCEFAADGSIRTCVGKGEYKTQAILDAEALDRIFVAGWSSNKGIVYSLPRSAPLRILEEVHTNHTIGEGYYDAEAGEIGLLGDTWTTLTLVRAADLSVLPLVHAPFIAGETRYDGERHEGVLCAAPGPFGVLQSTDGTAGYLSVAFRGNPFSYRLLGASPWTVWAYGALVWGCDVDLQRRIVWVPVANLPLIAVLDYDSGRMTNHWWADPGLRSTAFDAGRRLLYVSSFLRGDVIAFNVETGREENRWFVGRFVRQVVLARDQESLFAASNLGIVRIALPPAPS